MMNNILKYRLMAKSLLLKVQDYVRLFFNLQNLVNHPGLTILSVKTDLKKGISKTTPVKARGV